MRTDWFFDSSIVVYSVTADPLKAARSLDLLSEGGLISVQALNEFANVAHEKYKNSWATVATALAAIRRLCAVVPLTVEVHERGLELAQAHKLQLYDSMIIAAALGAGCATLWSEDMQDGRRIDGLTIRNPYVGQ